MSSTVASSARRRLSQAEADLLIEAHERFLAGRPGGRRASLRFVDFTGLELSKRDLSDADLTGSVFDECRMIRTRLERASLFGCALRKADLRGAVLVRADLRGVSLKGANLSFADLTQADLREGQIAIPHPSKGLQMVRREERSGDFDRVNFSGATLDGSQFNNASACAADFSDCSMRGVRLNGANLKDANLSGAIMEGAVLGGALMEGANLNGAVLSGVDLSQARNGLIAVAGCLMDPTPEAQAACEDHQVRIQGARRWCETGGKMGAPAVLDGADLRPLGDALKGALLTALSARNACLVGMDLSGAQLQGANLEGADLRGVLLRGADLRGARLSGANLTKADVRGAAFGRLPLGPNRSTPSQMSETRMRYVLAQQASFAGAVMDRADLKGADFTGAVLEGASFRGVDVGEAVGFELVAAA